ncbi:MAG TPA: outer membrane beta-barrel protein [Opitutaceae bacterium]|nr:outer membrane beta-barrel protein [Opitutaceae bacterium]
MKLPRLFLVSGLIAVRPVWAVYAPIPEQDQGKAWAVTAAANITYDSNIFGAPSNTISSTVYDFSPKIAFHASVAAQTFVSASYGLNLDYFTDRPGSKLLDSHALSTRLAHEFSPTSTIDLSDTFNIQKNPESALNGTVINSNQSFKNNEADGSFTTDVNAKANVTIKARSVYYRYDNPKLGTSLDRIENLYGISGDYAVLPELKAVGEYRFQTIDYRDAGSTKDKTSNYLLGGADYEVAKKLTASGRLGFEWRHRDGERNDTSPYVELSGKYDYAQGSYFTAGYVYTLEESSDPSLYTDEKVNRLFFNVQHAITGLITASGSIDYEPSQLQGRRGLPNVSETTTRFGLGLSYLPTKNWVISATYDYDNISSDDKGREQVRNRESLGARYSF